MRALAPWAGMGLFKGEIDRLLDRFIEPRLGALEPGGVWMPELDFSETKDAYVAKVEVPGVEPMEMNVSVRDCVLVITGEKTREMEEKNDKRFYRMERAWGAFTRTISLPGPVDVEKTAAAIKDGVLTVMLPKAAAKGSFIPVKAG
jgi:HSP20 family protein